TQTRLREAQQALEQAQPQLAALQQAQPADQLRPLWTRQQEQAGREEQEKLETTLNQRRQAYKEKNQQFSDVKAICELEARI
ncbi:hypothetical protein NGI12_25780, partial [Raoultella terrigena]|uniref:hypothetical protein n=1 Tax=Raoultella terrigena TaxID=577 RepID=UPI002DBD9BFC